MTIRQQGGVFGRNPSFNDVDVVDLTATGDIAADEFNGRRASLTEQVTINRSGANDAVLQMSNATAGFFVTQSGNGSTYILNYGNQKMYFGMNGAEDFHLDTNGNINMTQGGGNLIVANGAGIDFSATSGTGTSELFDDYEEGTWTPEITAATVGDLAVTYSVQTGLYTKIGRTVTVYASITTSSFTHSTASGAAKIANLPFTVGQRGVGALAYDNITKTNYTSFLAIPNAGTTDAELYASRSGGSTSTVKITEMPTAGTVFLQFTATYTV